jgi:ubiquinone/menaquinone biosynthesis C-methylase UbiE
VPHHDPDREYRTLDPLRARIDTHRRYSEHPEDVERAVLDAVALAGEESLLDVGSGTGSLLARLRREGQAGRLVGLDTSPAAIACVRELEGVEAVQAAAAALPFADGEFSVVTARHMLYHVADPSLAVREARRVLAHGGRFAATVNSAEALPETVDLLRTVAARHGVARSDLLQRPLNPGGLQALVEPVFGEVEVVEYPNALVYPDPDAFARYAVAMLGFHGVGADFPDRDAVVADVIAEAGRRFDERDGPLRDPKGYVVVAARRW